ncbi:TetR/AcrR family transcriptional regulator [Nonomuraea diastatica]|uniref:TetR/AcrR family transcriptional regulator n=1 Tax=Nonomuraea diastatica TaxID=1848329 RepID=A0A4R4WNZ5_9ACTN|nr:TetR/AcrR family transcriptional regulator [Nonomuraea diastatica]TDD19687.1 TetR/AcrR family transcriptional regulator [Nonomuraea diastatica]
MVVTVMVAEESDPRGTAEPRRRRDAAATRQALLEAARQRFARDRYEAVSVRDIAADVGVNVALVYRYFGSKAGLFAMAAADSAMFGQLDVPAEELPDRMAELYASGAGRSPGLDDLLAVWRLIGESPDPEGLTEKARDYAENAVVGPFATVAAGDDPRLRAELAAALLTGIKVLRWASPQGRLATAPPEQVVEYIRQGVGALLYGSAGESSK